MEQEKWVTVEIGGYRRRCPESKLNWVYEEAERFKQEYLKMDPPKGMTKETFTKMVEDAYTVEIVKDKD